MLAGAKSAGPRSPQGAAPAPYRWWGPVTGTGAPARSHSLWLSVRCRWKTSSASRPCDANSRGSSSPAEWLGVHSPSVCAKSVPRGQSFSALFSCEGVHGKPVQKDKQANLASDTRRSAPGPGVPADTRVHGRDLECCQTRRSGGSRGRPSVRPESPSRHPARIPMGRDPVGSRASSRGPSERRGPAFREDRRSLRTRPAWLARPGSPPASGGCVEKVLWILIEFSETAGSVLRGFVPSAWGSADSWDVWPKERVAERMAEYEAAVRGCASDCGSLGKKPRALCRSKTSCVCHAMPSASTDRII